MGGVVPCVAATAADRRSASAAARFWPRDGAAGRPRIVTNTAGGVATDDDTRLINLTPAGKRAFLQIADRACVEAAHAYTVVAIGLQVYRTRTAQVHLGDVRRTDSRETLSIDTATTVVAAERGTDR